MNKFIKKPKQGKANWTKVPSPGFQEQRQRLSPASGVSGGVKGCSGSQSVRKAIYNAVARLFLECNQTCQACSVLFPGSMENPATEVHHRAGRTGLLLFDPRNFLSSCATCHRKIHSEPANAVKLGLLSAQFNQQVDK